MNEPELFDETTQLRLENVYNRIFAEHITAAEFMNQIKALKTLGAVLFYLDQKEYHLSILDDAIKNNLLREIK